MNSSSKRNVLLAAVACPALIAAQSASAALIERWSYEIDSGFSNFTSVNEESGEGIGSVEGSGDPDVGEASKLTWGVEEDSSQQSSVSVDEEITGIDLETNGDAVDGATFTHNNQVVPQEYVTLDEFDLSTRLALDAEEGEEGYPTDASEQVGPITFDSFFTETLNSDSDCAVGDGSVPCGDVFVLTNPGSLGVGDDGDFRIESTPFSIQDYTYTVFLDIQELGPLSDGECGVAGAADNCIGFTTDENANNEFNTAVSIKAEQTEVPEPGTLALLGVGLAGLGFATRARKS